MNGGTPVTILSGALGAGKTTTLNHLLSYPGGRRIAVLVNDMGEVNVDAARVENRADGVAELSNGCICCDLRDDLEVAVSRLAREREFDYLVVESSGISEPAPVARLFTTGAASAPYDLDTLATVVNAQTFRDTLTEGEEVETEDLRRTRPGQVEREGGETRPLSELLVGQVECADVLLLNKCDLVSEDDLAGTEALLDSLNPEARVVRTTHGEVDPGDLLGTGLFDVDTVSETAAWQRAARHAEEHRDGNRHVDEGGHGGEGGHGNEGNHEHGGEGAHGHDHGDHGPQAVYGVDSFVFRARRPFHPERFAAFVRDLPDSVVRSKGTVWVAGRDEAALFLSQAGPSVRVEPDRQWMAAMSESRREMQRRMNPDVEWDDEHGDRRTELVVIGRGMDDDAVRAALEDCLLTDDEFELDPDGFENPFPGLEDDPVAL
ncbi:CobW family GTP-binding protein [Halorarum salinum]|uniref:GTP-binding protein n=1 Tax=Halorarum salinum TaxID=2743089 RepID=A0A7D5QE99_9EURY|nr:GTP-binding protein [Halobaculum salinum]QLG60603.1 GTP-binding protein [Halobaculum salinum]